MFTEIVAVVCIAWYVFIACVCAIGYVFLFVYFRQVPKQAAVLSKPKDDIPHVTVIRPCKGREPFLYECLASTLLQDYPTEKIVVYFCVSSRSDAAYETIEKVVRDFSSHDARIFVEEDDVVAEREHYALLGPNPKIRNMSRAYRQAKGDLTWIIDCNVWVGQGVCGRMVDRLCGFTRTTQMVTPFKLVHHLPISVDVDAYSGQQVTSLSSYDDVSTNPTTTAISSSVTVDKLNRYGGRLEELFLASSHAKMYVAINTVAVAPCIVGKSTMFRHSHLDHLTSQQASHEAEGVRARTGIDYFSQNICEDHLIGDLLWKSPVPALRGFPKKMRNHGLVYGDLAIQPVAGMSVINYVARRVRWLRVRKFTVPVATLVEPGTESFLCSAYGAFGVTTYSGTRDMFGNTWAWFFLWWVVSLILWASVDWTVYLLLHSGRTVENTTHEVPTFAKPPPRSLRGPATRRPFTSWLSAWLGREALALPIWTWAIWGGVRVTWRDRQFWVGMDMKVHEIPVKDRSEAVAARPGPSGQARELNGHASPAQAQAGNMNANGHTGEKKRRD